MNMVGLFSGIGGFELAATRTWGDQLNIKCMVEKDQFCQKVLNKNFPGVKIHGDIKTAKGSQFRPIDIVTGGFPCQSFSFAGKRKGKEDDRYLWPEMLQFCREAGARWIVGENVPGIINVALDEVLSDLENEGYEAQAFNIPACATNAKHRRDRIWIVANTKSIHGIWSDSKAWQGKIWTQFRGQITRNPTPRICRRADAIPCWMDRLRALGNAIVPQVAERIFWAIKEVDKMYLDI